MLAFLFAAALQGTAPSPAPPGAAPVPVQGLIRLFDAACNRTFPDDASLIAGLSRMPETRELTPEQVRGFLRGDKGRAWLMAQGPARIILTLEDDGPFHACAVRSPGTQGVIDEALWRSVLDAAQARAGGGFRPLPPTASTTAGMRVLAQGEAKRNANGSIEAFYLIRSTLVDPAKAPGFGTEIRLVHQIVSQEAR